MRHFRPWLVVPLLVTLGASACGSHPSGTRASTEERTTALPSTPVEKARLVPGWDSVTAVVVGMGESFGGALSDPSTGPGAQALFEERLAFYRKLVSESPEVRVLLFVDRPEQAAAAREAMGDAPNLSIVAQPSWVWMRDFAPLSASLESGARALVAYSPYQLDVNRTIAKELGLPLVQGAGAVSRSIEGGNVLVDDAGRCYTAVWSTDPAIDAEAAAEVRDLGNICSEVRTVPRLPHEPTGHIDIFARILDDRTAVVAEYDDESFAVAAEPVRRTYACTDEQVARAAWSECAEGDSHYPNRDRVRREEGGRTLRLALDEVRPEIERMFPGAEIETPPSAPWSMSTQLDKVAELFGSWGFEVVRVENPTPYLSLQDIEYQDADGRVVRRVVRADPVFPTYTNALFVNGRAYLPQYATASAAQNSAARRLFTERGFDVEPVDMTADIAFRGAARCLTMQIHGALGAG